MQDLFVSELAITVGRGLRESVALELLMPFRLVRDRVHYLDLARRPYLPPNEGLHHRNETLGGLADPQIAITVGRAWGAWALAGRAGVSIPIGKTEPDPFDLGDRGLWHQHIQFGTGTWDPVLSLTAGHTTGPFELRLSGIARLAFAENAHGYRAGNRYNVQLTAAPKLDDPWRADVGLLLAREEAEKWNGGIEEEGNLGRTDLFFSIGGGRFIPRMGRLWVNLQIPLASEVTGEQVDIPIIVSLMWGL